MTPRLHLARRFRAALLREHAARLRWMAESQRRGAEYGGNLDGVEEREALAVEVERVADELSRAGDLRADCVLR